jgi:RecQ mediated genome instability protein
MLPNLILSCCTSFVRLSTPPGTKFIVTSDIAVEEDLLMLGPGVLKNIGGHVEAMVNEWKASKVSYFHVMKAMRHKAHSNGTVCCSNL